MKEMIEVFRMDEVSKETRAKIIIQLGNCINEEHGANITEPLVYELVMQLDPKNQAIYHPRYTKHLI